MLRSHSICTAALQANLNSKRLKLRLVFAALGHGQRAMPEDAFKPVELQASMHDSVASQAKAGTLFADPSLALHDMHPAVTCAWRPSG